GPQAAGGRETGGGGGRGAAADGTEDPGGPAADRRTTLQGTGGRAVAGLPTTGTGPGRIETVARWRLSRRHGQGPGEDDRGQAEGAPGPGKEAPGCPGANEGTGRQCPRAGGGANPKHAAAGEAVRGPGEAAGPAAEGGRRAAAGLPAGGDVDPQRAAARGTRQVPRGQPLWIVRFPRQETCSRRTARESRPTRPA